VFTAGNLTGGSVLDLDVASESYALREAAGSPLLYTLGGSGTFTYEVGDTARVTVPGAAGGFPGSQVTVRLAEPLRVGPFTAPEPGQSFTLTWEQNGDANSGVVVSLRYGAFSSEGEPNRQLICVAQDDGSITIAPTLLADYFASDVDSREINVLRWRTNVTNVDERSRLYIISSADTTLLGVN
jgi:hypothetical protein